MQNSTNNLSSLIEQVDIMPSSELYRQIHLNGVDIRHCDTETEMRETLKNFFKSKIKVIFFFY